DPQRLRGRARAACRAQVLGDLGEREADGLRLLDRAEEAHRLLVVAAVPAPRAVRRREQSPPPLVAQRLGGLAPPLRHLADAHAPTIDPYLGTGIKQGGSRRSGPQLGPRRFPERHCASALTSAPKRSAALESQSQTSVITTADSVPQDFWYEPKWAVKTAKPIDATSQIVNAATAPGVTSCQRGWSTSAPR